MMRGVLVLALSLLGAASASAQVNGTLTWTQVRLADLTKYTLAIDGAAAIDVGLPPTNSVALALANGTHTIVLAAVYNNGDVKPTSYTVTAGTPTLTYLGCEVDSQTRVLPTLLINGTTNTPSACVAAAAAQGFLYAGVQYGAQCWGGNMHGTQGTAPEADCNMTCAGDATQKCGGSWRNGVYQTH